MCSDLSATVAGQLQQVTGYRRHSDSSNNTGSLWLYGNQPLQYCNNEHNNHVCKTVSAVGDKKQNLIYSFIFHTSINTLWLLY